VKIAVIGAGGWGTALAILAATNGHQVALWARRCELATLLAEKRVNHTYLPGIRLPDNVRPGCNGERALSGAKLAVIAVPAKGVKEVVSSLPVAPAYVSAVKGVRYRQGRLLRVTEIISQVQADRPLAVLSGPNLALEIAQGLPAAAVAASVETGLAETIQEVLAGLTFRVYTSSDVIGVELGGALKNVMALAAGMADGLKLGDNSKAALLTRGLREMVRFGTAHGGRRDTFYGLSGLGDLLATAASPLSRNRTAGERLAQGASLAQLEAGQQIVEGVYTTAALHDWAIAKGEDLPITDAVWRVVYRNANPRQVLVELMRRAPKME